MYKSSIKKKSEIVFYVSQLDHVIYHLEKSIGL